LESAEFRFVQVLFAEGLVNDLIYALLVNRVCLDVVRITVGKKSHRAFMWIVLGPSAISTFLLSYLLVQVIKGKKLR